MSLNKQQKGLFFVDSLCSLAHRLKDINANLEDLEDETANVGFKIDVQKTTEVRIKNFITTVVRLGGKVIEKVEKFYLVSLDSLITPRYGCNIGH